MNGTYFKIRSTIHFFYKILNQNSFFKNESSSIYNSSELSGR